MSIQARSGEDAYPIGRFILDRAGTLGLNRTDLVRRLGYRDIGGGHRVLNGILSNGIVPRTTHIANHLAAALEVDDRVLIAVVESTEWQRRDEHRAQVLTREAAYREKFRAHLRCETARTRPEPLFIAALYGVARLRHVALPDQVWQLDAEKRDALVKRAILDHDHAQNGQIPSFGKILSYVLVMLPGYQIDLGFPFDLNGERAGPMCTVQRLSEATLGIKPGDTRLTGLFKDVPSKAIRLQSPE